MSASTATTTYPVATAHPSPFTAARAGVAPIVTGEAVALDIRVARLGSRALALLLDLVVQVMLFLLLFVGGLFTIGLLGAAGLVTMDLALMIALNIIVVAIALLGYPTVMLAATRGRTLGKMAVGLRVVRDDGGPIGFRHALTRTLVGVAVEFPGVVMPFGGWVISMVSMMSSPLSKRVGDHAAGTFVIHERNLEAWGWVPAMPPPLAAWAATLDLAALDDDLALAVRHFLARNRQLREPARHLLGQLLARQVAEVTNPPPPAGTPGWAYLAAVHAERHARSMRRLAAVRGRAASVWPELISATLPPSPPAPALPPAPAPVPPPLLVVPEPLPVPVSPVADAAVSRRPAAPGQESVAR